MLDTVHESCDDADTARETEPNTLTGGERKMNETTAKELDRLSDWLQAQGMTPTQVLDCLKYFAGTTPPAGSTGK